MSDEEVNVERRRVLAWATAGVGAVGAGFIATPFVGSWNPSAKAKAAGAPVKVDISKLEPGAMVVEEWRGKPVYVMRRTPQQVENLAAVAGDLKDPDSDISKSKGSQPEYVEGDYRSIKPEIAVLIGLCTHLGCAPKKRFEVGAADMGGDSWKGGFFCPCHGSKFDLAGRVYKGVPASENLHVPPYAYESSDVIIIGEDEGAA